MIFFILAKTQCYLGLGVGGEAAYYPVKGKSKIEEDNLTFDFNHAWRPHVVSHLFFGVSYAFTPSWALLTEINAHALNLLGAGGGLKFCIQHRTGFFVGGGAEVTYHWKFKQYITEQHSGHGAQTPSTTSAVSLQLESGLFQIFPLASVGYDIKLPKGFALRLELSGLFGGFVDRTIKNASLEALGPKDTKAEIEYGFPVKLRVLTGIIKRI